MIVDIKTKDCVFITIGTETYYIDNSTGEHIMEHLETDPEYTKPLY